jgi:hypothetical protein
MKLIGFGLLAMVCFAGSPPRGAQLAPITIFTQRAGAIPAAVMGPLRAEVAAILAPVGFRFEWHDISSAPSIATAVELAVVTFRGVCDVPPMQTRSLESTSVQTLGFTSITDGEVLPFATLDCDRARVFLFAGISRLPAGDRPTALGRALGRILAHELFHILARTQAHGHAGVAKQSYSVGDLLAGKFELDEPECNLLRASPAYNVLTEAMRDPRYNSLQ